jgi:hypothetical protein
VSRLEERLFCSLLDADGPVDRLADQVAVAQVAGILLDEVQQDPAQ